jgi:CRISPR type I-E-associated protein CasB/Cse2
MSDRPWDAELVEELTALAAPDAPDRAALAHLRRGLDAPLAYTLGRVGWLFRRVPESKGDVLLRSALLVAGLFAWTKGDCRQDGGVNFGAAFGAGLTPEGKQQREKRFIDLLDTDARELPYKLRQALTLIARDAGIGLDWGLLLQHLRHWDHADRWVQKVWARGFWSAADTEQPVHESP